MIPESHFDRDDDLRRYEALLQMADLVVHHHGLPELFSELAPRLRKVACFDLANFSLYDPTRNLMRIQFWEGNELLTDQAELPLHEAACSLALEKQEPVVWADLHQESRFEPTVDLLKKKGVRSYCALPLTSGQTRLGALGLGSAQVGVYSESDVRLLSRVAELVALALENAMTHAAFEQEKERLEALLKVSTTLVSTLDVQRAFPAISEFLRRVFRHDYASLTLYDNVTRELRKYALDSPISQALLGSRSYNISSLRESATGRAFLDQEAKVYSREELAVFKSDFLTQLIEHGIRSLCCLPLITRTGAIGTLNLASTKDGAFSLQDVGFLKQVAGQVAEALDNARAYREIAALTDKLAKEKLYLEDEIRTALNFEEIIGEDPTLKNVLGQVNTVAPSDATVLILGETGTGKELIARAIHRMSSRKDAGFIKLNCAAIPTGLLESELFGHEKGAFTGAISQKVGRLELANDGTLFLDEVGEIPLELQPKLLRALQDHEFERLGGIRTIKVNIRLIAATNRDLAQSVADKEFRSDLYYRLHVFPIRVPPLRERTKDIPLLVRYFVQKFARRMNRQIENIPKETMAALTSWHWPGNVRELENFIERSVILSDGPTLNVPLPELTVSLSGQRGSTLESIEREHILRVLRETGGVIAGVHGAAVRLGMKRTTLQSRMQKMGISREEYEN